MPTHARALDDTGMARILIAGCGRLGSALAAVLREQGDPVWGLRRNAAALPEGVAPLAGDLTRPAGIPELPAGLDFVFYTAAAGGGDEPSYRRAYVDGPRNLLDALDRQGLRPRRLLFVSSSSVYGQQDGRWVDEDSPTEPLSYRGRVLLEGERIVAGGPFPSVIARLTGIYGPGRTRLIDAVREGRVAAAPEDPPVYTNRIHEADCAGMLAHLMRLDDAPPLCLGVDDAPAPRSEVVAWLAERLGVRLPAGDAGGPGRDSNKRCSNARLRASGYRLRFPTWREGYGALLFR